MRYLLTVALASSICFSSAQENRPPAEQPQAAIRSSAQEVLLDVVVRDKKGHLIKDITAKDFEVTDDGQRQTIRSFQLVGGSDIVGEAVVSGATAAAGGKAVAVGNPSAGLDPLRQIRIITLVFDTLGNTARNNARLAVNDLLKTETGPNLFFAVFSIDQQVSILQQYTTDKERIRKAVARVTSTANSSLYRSESDRISQEVKIVATQDAANASVALPAGGPPNTGGLVQVALAQLTLNMMQFTSTLDRTEKGRATLFALEQLITQQYRLPGRKTMLFFSEGMSIPPEYTDEFQGLISNANRANVSVYGIDARSLDSNSQNSEANELMKQAASGSRSQQGQSTGPVTRDQATSGDRGMEAIRANSQNSLEEISQKTGGFMLANTNDLRTNLHRVTEDVDTHYELAYSPDIRNFDGHFRKIAVTVNRPDVRIQTRSGYFALPFVQGQNLLSFEVPMLNALAAATLPRDILFRSSGLHFKSLTGDPEGVVVFDVPLDGIEFTKDDLTHLYQIHFSVLALVKDEQGSVVRKFSQDVPRQGPLDKLDAFKMGHFIYAQHALLAPGRYTLETAVTDRKTGKISAKKSVILIPPASESVGLSSVVRVRSFAPSNTPDALADDPFQVATGKISPGLDETAKAGAGSVLSLFFTVYVPAGSKTAPDLGMEFFKDGQLLGGGKPQLPAPDSHGAIPYIASTPLDSFKPGQYEVRVTVSQNGKAATERTLFTIE